MFGYLFCLSVCLFVIVDVGVFKTGILYFILSFIHYFIKVLFQFDYITLCSRCPYWLLGSSALVAMPWYQIYKLLGTGN